MNNNFLFILLAVVLAFNYCILVLALEKAF